MIKIINDFLYIMKIVKRNLLNQPAVISRFTRNELFNKTADIQDQ